MNLNLLFKLTENDKRVLIALCFAVILFFVLCGIIGSLIIRTMKWQGKKCDTLVSDVVVYRIITTPHQLRRYAARKNARHFIKQAWIPIIIILVGFVIWIIRNAVTKDWAYNPFNVETGFGSLLFTWDLNDPDIYTTIFGYKIIADWPKLSNEPHLVAEAIASYFIVPAIVGGGLWYIVTAQAYLARTIRAVQLSKKVFEKSLENFDQNTTPVNPIGGPQPPLQ